MFKKFKEISIKHFSILNYQRAKLVLLPKINIYRIIFYIRLISEQNNGGRIGLIIALVLAMINIYKKIK